MWGDNTNGLSSTGLLGPTLIAPLRFAGTTIIIISKREISNQISHRNKSYT